MLHLRIGYVVLVLGCLWMGVEGCAPPRPLAANPAALQGHSALDAQQAQVHRTAHSNNAVGLWAWYTHQAHTDTVDTDTLEADTLDTTLPAVDSLRTDTLDVRVPEAVSPEAVSPDADTVDTDTLDAPQPPDVDADSPEEPLRPLSLLPAAPERTLADTVLYRRAHPRIAENLAEAPGSFLYHLGPEGSPHGWARYGLAPHHVDYWVDDRRYADPVTQQPRYDLMPTLFLTRPSGEAPDGSAGAVPLSQQWRTFTPDRPLTELRYRRGGGDLQSIEAAHTQGRPVTWFGRPARFAATFGYGGRSTADTYPSTEIDLERQVLLRVRYQQNRFAVDLTNYSVRHRKDTHGGVEPAVPGVRASLFFPNQANVRDAARRQTIRNDLVLRARLAWTTTQPALQVTGGWTSNTFDYTPATETTRIRSQVWTTTVRQPLRWRQHQGALFAYTERNTAPRDTLATANPAMQSTRAGLRYTAPLTPTDVTATAQVHQHTDHGVYPTAQITVRRPFGELSFGELEAEARVATSARPSSRLETYGAGAFVTPLDAPVLTRTHRARLGLSYTRGPFDGQVTAFGHRIQDAVELERGSNPSEATARQAPSAIDVAGVSGRLRWRYAAERGLYAVAQATALEMLNATASTFHLQYAESLPDIYGRGRIGARFVLFQDLDIDLYAEAYGWSEFGSRWFHAPTGLLTLPQLTEPATPDTPIRLTPDGVMNVHAEIDLRGAKLMLSFENALGGTDVTPGTYMVPTYPLPNQRFRFGIHWPLFD